MNLGSLLQRRMDGAYEIDEWGLDRDLVALLAPAVGLRWHVETDWTEPLPTNGPAVLLYNRRWGISAAAALAQGVYRSTGRIARIVGVPDVAPIGGLLRGLGGVLNRPDEVRGLLRRGEVIAVDLGRTDLLDVVSAAEVPLFPTALIGHELRRNWRMVVGAGQTPTGSGGPLANLEFAENARAGVQGLLVAAR